MLVLIYLRLMYVTPQRPSSASKPRLNSGQKVGCWVPPQFWSIPQSIGFAALFLRLHSAINVLMFDMSAYLSRLFKLCHG